MKHCKLRFSNIHSSKSRRPLLMFLGGVKVRRADGTLRGVPMLLSGNAGTVTDIGVPGLPCIVRCCQEAGVRGVIAPGRWTWAAAVTTGCNVNVPGVAVGRMLISPLSALAAGEAARALVKGRVDGTRAAAAAPQFAVRRARADTGAPSVERADNVRTRAAAAEAVERAVCAATAATAALGLAERCSFSPAGLASRDAPCTAGLGDR